MTDRAALLDAGRAYLERWSAWLKANPTADEASVAAAMRRGDPPPELSVKPIEESLAAQWEEANPMASRIYWTIRANLEERDGGVKKHHHRVAVVAIHDSFPAKSERARLGLPVRITELAGALGVTDRVLRGYREKYRDVFGATRGTILNSFVNTYYGRVLETLGESAVVPGRDGAADRRLFLQIAGELVERQDVTVKGGALYITENRGGESGGDSG